MMGFTEGFIDATLTWVEYLGLPLLFLIFVSKGMLIGKIFPTSVFLPGYVILVRASTTMAVIIIVVTAIGYVIGQFVVFYGSRRYGPTFVERLPYASIEPENERFERFDRWFQRYGGASIFATNFVPWIRGLVTLPAATSSYSTARYLFHTTTSTMIYHFIYVALALGALEVVTRVI